MRTVGNGSIWDNLEWLIEKPMITEVSLPYRCDIQLIMLRPNAPNFCDYVYLLLILPDVDIMSEFSICWS